MKEMHEDRDRRERAAVTALERMEVRRAWERELDALLDRHRGACHLRDARVANMVVESLHRWDRDRYHLHAWCVMPNHVHVVIRIFGDQSLARLVHSWKSYTAHRANAILGRNGPFWQREYYDRIIRSEEHLEETIAYVLQNPVKAGLTGWRWVGRAAAPQ